MDIQRIPRAALLGALLTTAFLALIVLAGVGLYFVSLMEEAGGIGAVADFAADELADSLTEAGFDISPLDPEDPLLQSRTILVTEGINERTAGTVARKLFYLDRSDPEAPIDLYLATPGGWVDSAFVVIDAMREIGAPVNTIALGGCYSAGTMILAAGTGKRFATPNAIMSVHANMARGDEAFSHEKLSRERFEAHYREHTTVPDTWFPMTRDSHYYLSPAEAVKFKVIDEIRGPAA